MNGPWIKICGVTTPEAVSAAESTGVDAIGFVFAESPRRVTPERAFRLAATVRGRLACCAVVRRTSQAEVDEILRVLRPDLLQADVGELATLALPETLQVLPVASTRDAAPGALPRSLLLERPPADDGAGWDEDRIRALSHRTRLVLAGGLDADNVGHLVRSFAPWGVDVSRGVEVAPGIKGQDLIRRFVRAARTTFGAVAI
jgi:phosphoribosylanthranilate isomerase